MLNGLRELIHTQLERHHNLPFLKATMAACALVAIADGSIAFLQRIRVDQILEALEALKVFDPHEGVSLFNTYADAILEDPASGHTRAIAAITPMAKTPKIAKLLIRACRAISEASGNISLVEKIEMITLCSLLGVEPADCGLDPDYREAIKAYSSSFAAGN
ncbi:MAG: TerB family tellurite resistance protein [Mariprofundaceae bacterium]|nr:TerB family tellurite resistance protein [Mariprofundaceae bacterium]